MEKKKRIYVAPAMQVVELKARQTLLVGSSTEQLKSYKSGGDIWEDPDYDNE